MAKTVGAVPNFRWGVLIADSSASEVRPHLNAASVFILVLTAASFLTRFAWIQRPSDVVWDEQHFAAYAEAYFQGKFFFDVQPPLGHMILFSALRVTHAEPGNFKFVAGLPYPSGYPYIAARFMPALAGTLLPLVVFFIARALSFSLSTSFFAGALIVLDNAVLSESHFALIDIFVPFFGLVGVWAFLRHRGLASFTAPWWLTLLAAAIFAGLSLSVKWTGAAWLGVMAIVTFVDLLRQKNAIAFAARVACLCVIAAVVYISIFAVHFRLLPKAGAGDDFMSPEFRASLTGSSESARADIRPLGFWRKFAELNQRIFVYNANRRISNGDSSPFYMWPAGKRQIYLWVDRQDSRNRMAMKANPVSWFFALDAMVAGAIFMLVRRRAIVALIKRSEIWRAKLWSLALLFVMYFLNWLPFMAIKRDMYLYHYFGAFIVSAMIGSFVAFELIPAVGFSGSPTGRTNGLDFLYGGILAIALGAFILNAPFSYGFHSLWGV